MLYLISEYVKCFSILVLITILLDWSETIAGKIFKYVNNIVIMHDGSMT